MSADDASFCFRDQFFRAQFFRDQFFRDQLSIPLFNTGIDMGYRSLLPAVLKYSRGNIPGEYNRELDSSHSLAVAFLLSC
jgi:hypothetical protein